MSSDVPRSSTGEYSPSRGDKGKGKMIGGGKGNKMEGYEMSKIREERMVGPKFAAVKVSL